MKTLENKSKAKHLSEIKSGYLKCVRLGQPDSTLLVSLETQKYIIYCEELMIEQIDEMLWEQCF